MRPILTRFTDKNVYVLNKFSFGPSQEDEGRKKTPLAIQGSKLTSFTYHESHNTGENRPIFDKKRSKTTKTNQFLSKNTQLVPQVFIPQLLVPTKGVSVFIFFFPFLTFNFRHFSSLYTLVTFNFSLFTFTCLSRAKNAGNFQQISIFLKNFYLVYS